MPICCPRVAGLNCLQIGTHLALLRRGDARFGDRFGASLVKRGLDGLMIHQWSYRAIGVPTRVLFVCPVCMSTKWHTACQGAGVLPWSSSLQLRLRLDKQFARLWCVLSLKSLLDCVVMSHQVFSGGSCWQHLSPVSPTSSTKLPYYDSMCWAAKLLTTLLI